MSDGSSTEPAVVGALGTGALGQGDCSLAKPHLAVTGYCGECGTWDAHGLVCTTCGYDFGGGQDDLRDA